MSFVRAGVVRPIRPLIVLAAVSLALVVGAQSALGAEVVNKNKPIGRWTLRDTEIAPGGFCTYDDDGFNDLDLLEAKSPRVFARNRTSGRDGQWVGIRLLFQKSKQDGGSGGWQTVKSTGFIKKFARDDQAVDIGRRAWHASYDGTPHFRVRANVRWYRPGSKSDVQGAVTLAYEWYDTGGVDPAMDRCLPEP